MKENVNLSLDQKTLLKLVINSDEYFAENKEENSNLMELVKLGFVFANTGALATYDVTQKGIDYNAIFITNYPTFE